MLKFNKLNKTILFESGQDDNNIFSTFPPEIRSTLDNYSGYYNNFDWNTTADRFGDDGKGFRKFISDHNESEFRKNIDKIIAAIRSDLILIKRQKQSEDKSNEYEQYLIDLFGFHVTGDINDNMINIPEFERFVEENPRYQSAYEHFMKLHDIKLDYALTNLKSLHIVSYDKLKELYDFLLHNRHKI